MLLEIVLCLASLLLFSSFDWYFNLNVVGNLIIGRLRRQCRVTDTVSVYRISSTYNTDLTFDHLNNVKYIVYMDFAKAHFWSCTRLLSFLVRAKAFPLQSAMIIRYMRPIPIFSLVRIDTKLIWWDDRMIYLEHRFIIRKTKVVAAISMSRVCFERYAIDKVLQKYPGGEEVPEYPERFRAWIEALSKSSRDLIVENDCY